MTLVSNQVNTPLARTFRSIVTAGWATKSDGTVEAPTGAFALVLIEPAELAELIDACVGAGEVPPYPGSYLVVEDSDGNTELYEYLSHISAKQAYTRLEREYAIWNATCPKCGGQGPHTRVMKPGDNYHICACGERWDPTDGTGFPELTPGYRPEAVNTVDDDEKMYLVCKNCGEAFDSIDAAHKHGVSDPNTKVWCGEDGFDLMPESEAM